MPAQRLDIAPLLAPYAAELVTRCLVFEPGLLPRSASLLRAHLPAGTWLLVADPTTWRVAGAAVAASLERAGLPARVAIVPPEPGATAPVADDARVEAIQTRLGELGCSAAVAVGAGTVNDIVKTAADSRGLPYGVVATAPSMNGYTSSLSALLRHGVKITRPCRPAVVCLFDLDVLAAAPYRMIASGLGDLLSKPVSSADWSLAQHLEGEAYPGRVRALMEAGSALLDGVAERLPGRDPAAVGRLCASLCLSGLAMGLAGPAAPSSGAEHLVSHYLDMTHFAWGEPHDLHGCQVGVATVAMAALYERLAGMSPAQIDVEGRVAALAPWTAYRALVRRRFGTLADAVVEHARRAHPDPERLRARLTRLQRHWEEILAEVATTLRPAADLRAELERAQAPATFAQIGVPRRRARRALVHSKDIRARYTILHLAADLGLLETWAKAVLAAA